MLQTNFFKTVLASMLVVCVAGFYSCSSDDGPDDGGQTGTEADIIGKWEVKNSGGEYGSFEFTDDKKYIVTQRLSDNPVSASLKSTRADNTEYIIIIFGDYSAIDSKDNIYTLNLKEFGTITIEISTSGAIITVNGETYDTSKAEEVEVTDKTKLLCHTWNFKGEDLGATEEDYEDGYAPAFGKVTFTTTGTYCFEYLDEETGEIEYDYGTWMWKDDKTLYVSYTSYCMSGTLGYYDENGNYIPGETEYWTETGYEDWAVIKLSDKELIFEIDDSDDGEDREYIVTVTCTR